MESLPLDDSLPGWVVRNAQPLALRDMGSDQRTSAMFRSHFAERAMLAAPVRVRGQVLGAISVIGRVGQSLNLESIALLSSIADHVGVVVENALLPPASGGHGGAPRAPATCARVARLGGPVALCRDAAGRGRGDAFSGPAT